MALRDGLERALEGLWYQPRGWGFALAAPLLAPATVGAWLSSRRRNANARPAPALPTIAIGNLAVGGTGKTQIVQHLAARCERVAIVTRGYGGTLTEPTVVQGNTGANICGDEPLLLARRLPAATVIVARDRAQGVAFAKERGCALVLLDDGLQQTSVEPTARVVVFGAESPLGNGALLPLGPLREPLSALRNSDLVWLHGEGAGSALPWVDLRSRTRALGLVALSAFDSTPLPLRGKKLFAFAGIARPERFFATLRRAGAEVVGERRFADHRKLSEAELRGLAAQAAALGAEGLVCTEKDAVRIAVEGIPVFALRTELEILEGVERVTALLESLR